MAEDNPRHAYCVPIRTESGLGSPPVINRNLSTIYDIALYGEVPEMASLKLKLLRRQTWNCDM